MRLKKRLIKTGGVIMKLFLLFIFGWPFFWMISTSLQTIDEVNRVTPTFFPAVLQFHNYLDAWHSGPAGGMWIYLKNSIIVVLSVILLQMLVVVPAAYAFAKYEFKGKKIMFGSILIALMMPTDHIFTRISDDVQMGADKLPASSNITIYNKCIRYLLTETVFYAGRE